MRVPFLFDVSPRFDGAVYDPALDQDRLTKQLGKVFEFMRSVAWHTLSEIHEATDVPEASASAQLRHLRKRRFGAYRVDRRRRTPTGGTFEYRLMVHPGEPV